MPALEPDKVEAGRVTIGEGVAWLLKRLCTYAGWAFVRTVSAFRIALQCCDPRIHFERFRIQAIADGGLASKGGKVAIFVVYCNGELPPFTRSMIDALGRSEFDLVLVSNGNLDPVVRSDLLGRCHLLIERANVGRDFGAYKDGIAIVRRMRPDLQRLLLANDSVFYLPEGLDGLIAGLAAGNQFIGVSEVFEHHYHVASFLFSFGRGVLESRSFNRFWTNYLPIGTRRWAILRGEGALTATLMEAGFQPHVLYRADMLLQRLEGLTPAQLRHEITLLPKRASSKLLEQGPQASDATAIAAAIHARNQMHFGGLLFRRHLGLPIIKRDLAYRRIFSVSETLATLGDVDPEMRKAIEADLRSRPDALSFGPVKWVFYRFGAI